MNTVFRNPVFRAIAMIAAVLSFAAACAAPPPVQTPAGEHFQCRGNEPFWALGLTGPNAVLETPGDPDVITTQASGVEKHGEVWMIWRGKLPGWGDTAAFITPAQCEDSMSGRPSPYRAILSLPTGEVHHGCCDKK